MLRDVDIDQSVNKIAFRKSITNSDTPFSIALQLLVPRHQQRHPQRWWHFSWFPDPFCWYAMWIMHTKVAWARKCTSSCVLHLWLPWKVWIYLSLYLSAHYTRLFNRLYTFLISVHIWSYAELAYAVSKTLPTLVYHPKVLSTIFLHQALHFHCQGYVVYLQSKYGPQWI